MDSQGTRRDPPRPRWERLLLVAASVLGGLAAATVASIAFEVFTYMSGLDGTEELDRSTQPLEVVVDGPQGGCVLNVDAVAPGVHEVAVIAEGSRSRVVIRDASGRVVFRHAEEADGIHGPVLPTARLRLGRHRVSCSSAEGEAGTATLLVLRAEELG